MTGIRSMWAVGGALGLCLAVAGVALHAEPSPTAETLVDERPESDLSYTAWVDSNKRFKCLYGYAADKTGDHEAAIRIFEDCIDRWEDVYSMIWLAQILENGQGGPNGVERATALMKRGAAHPDTSGYATLARYHYGMALLSGHGVEKDETGARRWLERAAREGLPEAQEQLDRMAEH
ncbi:sel1 repeat family protein [Hydrogenophaga sp. 5NK40-0174]|uniref:tetratricopeptide repeat protein n=1 Tax=Hydrogenophaga sp. 5NK40-0174 TaxID=3127649 RepID=UPI003341D3BB